MDYDTLSEKSVKIGKPVMIEKLRIPSGKRRTPVVSGLHYEIRRCAYRHTEAFRSPLDNCYLNPVNLVKKL